MTYIEAIAALRRLDDIRNGQVEVDDLDTEVTLILDAMPAILEGLDPSRAVEAPALPEGEPEDLPILVAREMWLIAWQACLSFQSEKTDLFRGNVVALAIERARAKLTHDDAEALLVRVAKTMRWHAADIVQARSGWEIGGDILTIDIDHVIQTAREQKDT